VRAPSRTTKDVARLPQIPADGEGGGNVETAQAWARIEKLHAHRFGGGQTGEHT
jgi:hypothetical protein